MSALPSDRWITLEQGGAMLGVTTIRSSAWPLPRKRYQRPPPYTVCGRPTQLVRLSDVAAVQRIREACGASVPVACRLLASTLELGTTDNPFLGGLEQVSIERDELTYTLYYESTPYIPGYTSGPPDSCYPDEGGVEPYAVYITLPGGITLPIPDAQLSALPSGVFDELMDAASSE